MNYVSGDLRDQLAHVGLDVVRAGLVVGSGGNLSARAPGADACWVTATGTWLDRLERSSFARVRIPDATVLAASPAAPAGPPPSSAVLAAAVPPRAVPPCAVPTSELALHLAIYRVRPDVNAVVHLHPQTVLLLDALDEHIRLVTTDHAFYLREVVRTPFRMPGGAALADEVAAAVRGGVNAVVLAHHGCSVLGPTVELAHKRARYLEEAALLTYRALAAGMLPALPGCPEEFVAKLAGDAPAITV